MAGGKPVVAVVGRNFDGIGTEFCQGSVFYCVLIFMSFHPKDYTLSDAVVIIRRECLLVVA